MTTRQITLVFEVDEQEYPELISLPMGDIADNLAISCDLDFECEEAYDVLIDEKNLTHILIRHLEDGVEKQIVARRLVEVIPMEGM